MIDKTVRWLFNRIRWVGFWRGFTALLLLLLALLLALLTRVKADAPGDEERYWLYGGLAFGLCLVSFTLGGVVMGESTWRIMPDILNDYLAWRARHPEEADEE